MLEILTKYSFRSDFGVETKHGISNHIFRTVRDNDFKVVAMLNVALVLHVEQKASSSILKAGTML